MSPSVQAIEKESIQNIANCSKIFCVLVKVINTIS